MGNNRVDIIRYFVKVIQFGSFSKAAENLGVPKSTVSKAISGLEKDTGTALLVRTTRSLTLTAAGRAFYEACLDPIQKLEDAHKSLQGNDTIVSGLVRITAPEDLGGAVIAKVIAQLSQQYPQLSFDLHYSDQIMDLVRDGFDFAIRIGTLSESRLKAKYIGDISLSLVASSNYLKKTAKIKTPKDLEHHCLLSMKAYSKTRKWSLRSKKGSVAIPIQPQIVCNQMTSLLQMAIAGGGIALVPTFLCHQAIQEEKLVYVLPEWQHVEAPVSLVSPLSTQSSARLKIVSDKLIDEIKSSLNR